jgi:hypothetical protein
LAAADKRGGQGADAKQSLTIANVKIISRRELRHCRQWQRAFASQHKDSRYYEVVEDTIHPEFHYLYFAARDCGGEIRAIQPFFVLDQDILAGLRAYCGGVIDAIRRRWPRFMVMKTMMIGCVAGEAHLDDAGEVVRVATTELLAAEIIGHARALGVRLVVLKGVSAQLSRRALVFRAFRFHQSAEHAPDQA